MTAVLDAPAAAQAPAPAVRRSRWRAVVAAVLALAGLAGTALLVWAPHAVDLRAGATTFGGSAVVVDVPELGLSGTQIVDYRHGASLELRVPLRNDGPLPLTVTGVETGLGVAPLLSVTSVDPLPLRLGPGEERTVVLRGVLGNCRYYHERQVQDLDAVLVTSSVLGREATSVVPLRSRVMLKSPMIVTCPDRTLDRDDDRRRDVV